MSTPLQKVAIIGGGGHVGGMILRALTAAPELSITAFKRPGSSSTFPSSSNLKVVETSYDVDALASHLQGHDTVISVVGGTGIGDQKPLIDAAVKAGVKRFFPSEFGINRQTEAAKQLTPFFAAKQDVLDYLVEKEAEGLTWTALVSGFLLDYVLEVDFLYFDRAAKKATIWDDGNTRMSMMTKDTLGKAVVSSLRNASATANKVVYVSSITVTQNEILQALEQETSTKWTVEHTTTKAEIDAARAALGNGDFSGAFTLVKSTSLANLPGLGQHFESDEKEKLLNKELGIEREDLHDIVKRALAA